jgi:acyl-CoA synthetase (AMP-forming)/AMP-acid ligase II
VIEEPKLPESIRTIPEVLSHWAERTPDAVAMLAPGREPATYRELHDAVARLATELRDCGLGRHDGIALLFSEGADFSLALLAAQSVGVAIPLAWPAPEMEERWPRLMGHVRAVLASAELGVSVPELAQLGLPVITLTSGEAGRVGDFRLDGESWGAPILSEPLTADDRALILQSSGTTGRPKLAPITHGNVMSLCRAVIEARGITAADRCLSTAGATSSQGVNTLLIPLFAGATLISIPGLGLEVLPRWLRDFRPTYISTTPAVLRTIAMDRGQLRDAFRQSPLRCIHSTAGPLSPDEMGRLEATLGAPILNGYGMTEATAIAGERYLGSQRVPGSVAVGPPWCEVRIVDERNQPVAPGESGEIVVQGPRVFAGYLDDAEANAAAFLPGGWFRTGDVGYLNDGVLFVSARRNELINRGGEKIAPADIDYILLTHPAVADAAVFAIPDARLGEDIVAAVVLKPDMTVSQRELRSWMLDRLSPYKVPRRIWMIGALPRTRTGKVQRGALADRFLNETRRTTPASDSPRG